MPSKIYKLWDIVVVPFPYAEREKAKRRPAIIVAAPKTDGKNLLYWVMMITSADQTKWQGDVAILDYESLGLSRPCIIRMAKMTTLQGDVILRKLGSLDAAGRKKIRAGLKQLLEL